MASLKPFAALRPKPELASQICELPYDVMSSEEAREMASGNDLSFLHVSKPEIDLPAGTDPYSAEVYTKGRENFERLMSKGALRQEAQPSFYLYRQVMGSHTQTGLVAGASCQEYLDGVIKKHELTRVDKEDDRVRHIEALDAQTGPVFLTYRAVAAVDEFIAKRTAGTPDVDFTGKDGVRHTSWTIADMEGISFVKEQFKKIPFLYIADGHHRSAAAARVFQAHRGAGETGKFLSVIFPHNQMQILPYNRVLKEAPAGLMARLAGVFEIKPGGPAKPSKKHELALYFEGKWSSLTFKEHSTLNTEHSTRSSSPDPGPLPSNGRGSDPIERLDVSMLQKHVLAPVFGIDDPRTSKRIHFVGGIRGTAELEKLVDSGEYACAFSMYPTSIEDLMSIADAGGIMPPKSTWFEPKLRDAMFCHMTETEE